MNLPFAAAHAVQALGMLVLAALVAGWLLSGGSRLRSIFGVLVLAAAPLVLASSVIGDNDSSLPTLSPALIVAGLIAGAAVLAAATALFVRFPRAVIPAALLTLPFRVPIAVGGESVKLLLPLYLVIAGAVCAHAWSAWRGREVVESQPVRLLDVSAAVFLGLYALQSAWSGDVAVATQNFCFFYAPFVLLYGLAARQRWDAQLLRWSAGVLVGVALVLVFVGFIEFALGEYLVEPGGIRPNDFDPYFRVQSLFFDPNIYGRFVAIVMIVVCALMLFTQRTSRVLLCALVLALLWAGLVISLSQSSFAALLSGLIALAAMRWRAKPVLVATGAVLLAGIVFAIAFPSVSGIDVSSSRDFETSTSGRFDLVTGAFELWGEAPFVGNGSGDFSRAFSEQRLSGESAFGEATTSKSHTAPLTVLAEQGIVGLIAFGVFIWFAFAAVYRRVGTSDGERRPGLVARIAVAAAFTALFVHSLAYAALLEDPLFWTMLGAAVSLAAIPREGSEPE